MWRRVLVASAALDLVCYATLALAASWKGVFRAEM